MANRKITVLNPLGYQEIFQSGDNLLVDGSVNLQSNNITGVPAPAEDTAAANRKYVDDADKILSDEIDALDDRVVIIEGKDFLLEPTTDGSFVVVRSAGVISYSEDIDGGQY